jgi:hypothetical protein
MTALPNGLNGPNGLNVFSGVTGKLYTLNLCCYYKNQNIRNRKMINYILLYKIRKKVKKIIKDKIEEEELATTEKSCVGCVADEISWEIYYLMKEESRKR